MGDSALGIFLPCMAASFLNLNSTPTSNNSKGRCDRVRLAQPVHSGLVNYRQLFILPPDPDQEGSEKKTTGSQVDDDAADLSEL